MLEFFLALLVFLSLPIIVTAEDRAKFRAGLAIFFSGLISLIIVHFAGG